jgi:nucleoid-associated protein YgaU
MILRISFYVSLAVLVTLTSCVSGGFESGEYDYNYDSPAAALAETADPAPKSDQGIALAPEPVTVQMQAGDTLYSLSVKHLGTGRRWMEIASLNGFSDAQVTNLSIGQLIKLPVR